MKRGYSTEINSRVKKQPAIQHVHEINFMLEKEQE
jgi:hypothetical protein